MSKLKEALDFLDSEDEKRAGSGMAAAGGGSAVDRALSFLDNASSGNSNAPARYAPADNANTAYQQYAKEYAQYGSQYQRQLVQGKTGRQWAADVNKRLEELQAQQKAAKTKNKSSALEDPSLWVTTTEQYDALPDAMSEYRKREASRKEDSDAYDKQMARLLKEKEWADYFADAGLSDEAGYKTGSARGKATYESADAAAARKRVSELEQRLVTLNQNSGWASTVEQSDEIERERNAIQQELESLGAGYKNAQQADYTMSARNNLSDRWTREERDNFYYLYNGNKDEAQAYARRINDRYAYSDAQAKKEKVGEWASQNFWTGAAGTVASVGMTMTSLADTLDRTREYAATGDVSAKSNLTPADIGMAMTSAIHSALNEKSGTINEDIPFVGYLVGGKGLGDLYEMGVSVLNSLASMYMMGGVGTYANFFGQASKTAYEEGIQRGLGVDEALTYGYASGVAEVAGEIFSIEHLIKMKNPSSLKGIIKNIFVQGGIEASEESATTLMNTISDAIINGDKSELSSNYYALIQAGYSSEEASQLAISDWTQGIMYDALGGFVSGVASAGVQSTVQGSMTYAGDAQELIDYAKSEGADTAAAKRAQKYEKRVQSGKRMTNYQAGTLTELAQEAVVSKDLDNIREAVGKRLSALGENSSALTEAVVRQAVQQEAKAADVSVPKVTEKQRGLIQNSKAAKRVLSEMDIGNMRMETAAELSGHDSSQYQRSNEWARDIGTRIIAPSEYGIRSTNTVTAEEKRADVKVGDESGKVVGFKNGMARVEVTENGKSTIREVKPDDVQQLPKQTRRLFDEISRYDGDTQAAMYAAYMPGQDIEAYVQAADTAMNLYGAQTKATLEQARSFGKATFRMLSDAQLDALMQAGRKLADQRKAAAERTGESKGEVKQGKVSYDGGEADGRKLKAPSKEAIDRMSDAEKTLAEALTATGVNVVFYESEANAEGKYSGAQGMYHNGTVYLDVNAGMNSVESGQRTIVLTAAHEMTHFIRENSEAGYIALREFITDRLMQQGLDIEELITQKRARESRELSYDEAVEEVIADACETVLTEPTAIQQLASDNMPLAKKIRKWLNDFFRKIKSAFAGLEAVHDEAKAMTDYMDELRAMWDDALSDAVRNRANKNAAENGDGVKHSYGGRGAENANLDELDRAKRLLAQGVDKDAVRRDTGWFRGADGQWRFEIDDSGLIYSKTGNILGYADSARAPHEYAVKWLALTSVEMTDTQRGELAKYIKQRDNGEFSQELYDKLAKYWGTVFEDYAAAKEAMLDSSRKSSGGTVGDYIKHDELFKQYPQLRDIGLVFEDLNDGEKGYFDGLDIVIDRSLKDAPEKTLLHEIQHAIQRFEGFSKGASVGYWNRQLEAGKNVRTRAQLMEEARIENQLTELRIKSPDFYADIMQLEEMAPTIPRGKIDWNTLEQIEPDPPEWKRYDTRREELEQKYGEDRVFSAIDLFNDLAQSRKTTQQLPSELYFNTAGEIEARDVSARAALTKAERAAKAPNLGDGNTVWAKYSIREDAPAEIHKAVTDKKYQGDIWLTDTTPSIMLGRRGVKNLPMLMKASHIRENILTKQEAAKLGLDTGKGINYHGLGEKVFKKVIDSLDDISVGYRGTPKAKDPSRRENSFLLISTVKDGGGNTIVVPVYINEMGDYNRVFMQTNKIASVYGKSGLSEYIKREVANGNLVRIKKRSPANSESSAPIAVDYNGVTSQAKAANKSAMASGNTSIRSSSENSNTKIKKSERDVDLSAKYPQLNLNEDISELDGVPAIELTDGSVLPITERDGRYPTHVSFIEANRIDVDDLKSGGWIGNGVYDPSFTSDTQRYIERQQARKRVAELTGKPYEQFRYSMRDDAMTDRELLARALDSVAATESERKLLAQYRTEFDRYQELYDKLDDAQIEYSAARRAVDDAYAQAKRSKLTAEERRRTEGAWRERIGALKATQQEAREARDKLLKEVDAQDRKLLKLRAMNPVKDMLSRARADMRETIKARQSKTDARAKVRDMAKKLSDLLLKESKDKHVLLELQKPVAEVLDMLNLDTVNAAERVAKYDAAIAKTTDPEMKRELAETRDRIQTQGDRLKTRLDALHTAYQAIANSADPTVANGYDENIAAKMQEVSQLVGDTPLAKMTQEQLDAVHDLLKMTYTVVSKANKAFVLNQKAGIEERAQAEIDRLSATEGADLGLKPVQFAKRQFWSMLKPGEIFHKVGGELEQTYNEVRKGEDVRARDVVTARSFFQQAAEKHGYFSWALEEKHDFVSAQGRPFSLSLDDMMSVYATSRREQGKKHLEAGGIVFGKNGKIKVKKKGVTLTMSQIKARAYTLDEQVLDEIIGKLTPEQKAFVEEMENWLSTKPAEWGNEVSRELYGINLFKEKVYWPIKSASEYLQSRSGDSDNVKIKNSGFTRSTVEKANNPIYIGGFVDTWSQHVYEMATYHGFTLPLEDFTRIFNYATSASDIENGANSVKAMLTNAFGSEAPVQQIELLLKDVNGSARSDPTTELMNKGLAFMKKYAVAGSLSVSIQQPSAIARATAYIDPKYFAGEKITAEKHKELWEHMKKYAPVAAIKEIGYFDQGLGRSAREWMTAREYDGLAEKAKGLVTDSNYRSDVIMALPGLMDELTWCSIWQAVEREVADTTNLKTGSEEFNKRVGDRFTQIITETQVYDSVFSRSAMMRSKDVGVKMATAFMAEPLTNVSMTVDAIDDFRNGRAALGARKLGSVVASMLLDSILKSFVYAARNDDDDKSYIEKYIAALTGELKDGFNPLTYIPYIKDVVSIVQGYDVERNDMTMIADLWNAYTSLKSDKKSTYRKIEDFAGRIAQIFGLPLKNVMRDMRAAYYTYDTIANGEETTWKGALQAVAEGWTGESPSNSEQLYDALVSGNTKQADRVKARFEDESAAQAAVKKVIREKFAPTDGGKQSIDKQTAIKQLQDYAGMSKQEAEKQVAKWTVSLAYGFEYGDTKDEYLNGNITIDKAKRVLMGAGATDMEADAKTLQWKFEKDTGIAYDDMSDAYVSGDISRSDAVNYLVKYGKTYRTDAEATVQQWQCEKDTGFKYSELKDLYVAGTISADRAAALRSKYGGASEDDAKSTVLQWQCVKDTGIEYSDIRKAYEEKRVSGETVENMLMKYGGKSKDDAAARREKYDFTIANPGTEDISDAAVQKYNESVAAAGISGKDYYTSWQMYNRTESDYDENGKPISYSKLYKIAAYIDSLNLTNAQKDAMFCAFYTARNLRRTPWH